MRSLLVWMELGVACVAALAAVLVAEAAVPFLVLALLAGLAGTWLRAGTRAAAVPALLLAVLAGGLAVLTGVGNIAWSTRDVAVWVLGSLLFAAFETIVAFTALAQPGSNPP